METVIGKQTEPKEETAPVKEESAAKKDLDDLSSAFGDDDFKLIRITSGCVLIGKSRELNNN